MPSLLHTPSPPSPRGIPEEGTLSRRDVRQFYSLVRYNLARRRTHYDYDPCSHEPPQHDLATTSGAYSLERLRHDSLVNGSAFGMARLGPMWKASVAAESLCGNSMGDGIAKECGDRVFSLL